MSVTAEQVANGTYVYDPLHSSIGFGVRYNKLATFRSSFNEVEAQLVDGKLTGSVEVSSIDIDIDMFKGHLLSEEWFNAGVTPKISFSSTDIRLLGGGRVEVDGELTIRGVARPVTATGTYAEGTDAAGGERVGFQLEVKVDRTQFDLNWQNQLPDGTGALEHEVTITAELQLAKQG